jgi:hypothetical protein
LGAPFTERFFELALTGGASQVAAGFVGLITANSFMKREFGSKLIEQVLPRLDLTHVVDTSGAYIPGHGTPTVILFGRHRAAAQNAVRAVLGIKGEPYTPNNPAYGLVWSAIVSQIDQAGSESEFISVADVERAMFSAHPWSIGGGGASDLKAAIEDVASVQLGNAVDVIGYVCMTRADDIYFTPKHTLEAQGIGSGQIVENVQGDAIRDWRIVDPNTALFPYEVDSLSPLPESAQSAVHRFLWPHRTGLWLRREPNGNHRELGLTWWEWSRFQKERFRVPLSISFAFVATHNHFVIDRGGKIFNRSAPVIKLPAGASEDDHLGLLGFLNSSLACFWMKQVFHNKGSTVDQHGARQRTDAFEDFYEFTVTGLKDFPLVGNHPIDIATRLDTLARQLAALQPASLLAEADTVGLPSRTSLDDARTDAARLCRLMFAGQEELDWRCYRLYSLLPVTSQDSDFEYETPPEVALGERAFEIVLARRMAAGVEATTWFARHSSTPITEIPSRWPEEYRRVVQRRIDLIASDRNIGLIERPEYKRRWNLPQWETVEHIALGKWLLDRLEAAQKVGSGDTASLTSTNKLADQMRTDANFMQVAALYAGHADFDPSQLVAELVSSEAVPFLPILRYTETGLRKRAQWEDTWALQRREDVGETVGKIAVPPKYQSKDFVKSDFWRLRGGLDVPKERWISYPGCERGADGSLVIAWAGWDHLQQAAAIAAYYLDMKENEGWPPERLQPMLAGIQELLSWLKQWHNDLHPAFGERMGNYYEGFVTEEARALGFTLDGLRAWRPATTVTPRRRRSAQSVANT